MPRSCELHFVPHSRANSYAFHCQNNAACKDLSRGGGVNQERAILLMESCSSLEQLI